MNVSQQQENQMMPLAIPDLYNKNFFIPDYQRGYRWGQRQVEQLLGDLYSFFKNGSGEFYCLQPVVVKALTKEEIETNKLSSDDDNNQWYEVVDGQQRLTTIRIMLELFKRVKFTFHGSFNIHYKTRPELGKVFDGLIYDARTDPYSISVANPDQLDIDSWHIFQAAQTILNWIKNGVGFNVFEGSFCEKFNNPKDLSGEKSVQVIWYELRDGSDPNETFKRLNDKKVSLNNAELIRAMFLSDSASYEYDETVVAGYPKEVQSIVIEREQARKQAHIIEQWDVIEKQLRAPKFWAFVKNDVSDVGYSCRIEYLFDLISQKKGTEKDELFTYLRFNEMVEKQEVKGLWELWLKVESNFATLLSWYYSRDNYHKIGYLIAEQGSQVLIGLLEKSTTQTKTSFAKNIDWLIKKHMLLDTNDDIYAYSYNNDAQKAALKSILFYYNVETIRQSKTHDFFPFNLYKNEEWTLEHIHAQNSERIDKNDKKKWEVWKEENLKVLKHLQSRFEAGDKFDPEGLIVELESADIKKNNFGFQDFAKLFDSVNAYYNNMALAEGGTPEIHNISNMALLSGSVNSSISNSVFEVKRQLILESDAKGKYIPYCTRQVFLKYFNKDKANFTVQQSFYWSESDRISYLENIKATLKDVLKAEDPDKTVNAVSKI